MAANESPKTLQEAIIYYADPDVCQDAVVAARWPDGVTCPTCGSRDVSYLATQRRWQCRTMPRHPRRQFSVKVGTIFEDSPISLPKWFAAIWLIQSAKNGVSSYEIHRAIGVTQKTAWFMLHRIRLAMQTKTFDKLGGSVEADETYIGGKGRNMHKDKRARIGLKHGLKHGRQDRRHGSAGASSREGQEPRSDGSAHQHPQGACAGARSESRRSRFVRLHRCARVLHWPERRLRSRVHRPRREIRGRQHPHERLRELLVPAEHDPKQMPQENNDARRFERLLTQLVRVPKREIDERERQYQKDREAVRVKQSAKKHA